MSYSELVLVPGSGRPLTLSLLDKNNQPIDFTTGTWRADLFIVEYPGSDGVPFSVLTTSNDAGRLKWLSLNDSAVTITPDPDVTDGWDFYKYHFDLYIQGPNAQSEPERVDHGSLRMDV